MTASINLRPYADTAGDRAAWAQLNSEAELAPFNWFGLRPDIAFKLDDDDLFVERRDADGTTEIIGSVGWHTERYGPTIDNTCCNIGINLIRQFRGNGYGAIAQRLLAEHLFATTTVNRVEASTDVDNIAEQRSLAKAGFTREGVLRGAQFRDGTFHDLVVFSRLRADPELPGSDAD